MKPRTPSLSPRNAARRSRGVSLGTRCVRELVAAGGDQSIRRFRDALPPDCPLTFDVFLRAYPDFPVRFSTASVAEFPLLSLCGPGTPASEHPAIVAYLSQRRQPGEPAAVVFHRSKAGAVVLHNLGPASDGGSTLLLTRSPEGEPLTLETWQSFLGRWSPGEIAGLLSDPQGVAADAVETPALQIRLSTSDLIRPSGLSPFSHVYTRDDEVMYPYPSLVEQLRPNVVAGLILSQVAYYFSKDDRGRYRASFKHGGERWWCWRYDEIAETFNATREQVKSAMRLLKERGHIVTEKADGQVRGFRGVLVRPGERLQEFLNAGPRQRRVRVPQRLYGLFGGHSDALVVGQLAYWFDDGRAGGSRVRCRRDGEWWVYKTHEQLAAETGLTACQVRDAVQRLEQSGTVVKRRYKVGKKAVSHYRFDIPKFVAAWDADGRVSARKRA